MDARVHRKFHAHPKVRRAGLKAVGLWTIANSWCRDHHKNGFVPDEFVKESPEVAQRLVDAGLWLRVDGGFRFKDWGEWNADDCSDDDVGVLVDRACPAAIPRDVKKNLVSRCRDLLSEGTVPTDLERALKKWGSNPDAGVGLLPFLVAEVVRSRHDGELLEALRKAWTDYDVTPLSRWGLVFVPPDIPADVDVKGARELTREAKRQWIAQIGEGL